MDASPPSRSWNVPLYLRIWLAVVVAVALLTVVFTAAEAEERLSEAGHKDWRKQKPRLDSAAAQIILLQYFESAKHADS